MNLLKKLRDWWYEPDTRPNERRVLFHRDGLTTTIQEISVPKFTEVEPPDEYKHLYQWGPNGWHLRK